MSTCPLDGAELEPTPGGGEGCKRCRGTWISHVELEAQVPGFRGHLKVESRADSLAFKRRLVCPDCLAPLTPMRVGTAEQWIERCGTCEHAWLEVGDLRTLQNFARQTARQKAYASLPKDARAELTRDLAQGGAPGDGAIAEISGGEAVLLVAGVPVVRKFEGEHAPIATWALAAVLLAVHVAGVLAPDDFGPEKLAWPSGALDWRLLSAGFAHFGWAHVLMNIAGFIAFGRGVEKRLPRRYYVPAFLVALPTSLAVEGPIALEGTLVAGASGAIAAVLGACVWLQPNARVLTTFFRRIPFEVPIGAFVALWVCLQYGLWALGVQGVAWGAHLAGLAAGFTLGPLARRVSR